MAIRPNDTRWKTASASEDPARSASTPKEAGSKLTKEQIIKRLFDGANHLFDSRVQLRRDYDMLQDAYDDATGLVTQDMYADPQVKETRDKMYQLDHAIGEAAHQMEYLARVLKGIAPKKKY